MMEFAVHEKSYTTLTKRIMTGRVSETTGIMTRTRTGLPFHDPRPADHARRSYAHEPTHRRGVRKAVRYRGILRMVAPYLIREQNRRLLKSSQVKVRPISRLAGSLCLRGRSLETWCTITPRSERASVKSQLQKMSTRSSITGEVSFGSEKILSKLRTD